jgi:transposase
MSYSTDLTNTEWKIYEPLLPVKKRTRPLKWSKRQILNGLFYQLKNGCNWNDLPRDLPPYSTVYWHYKQWRDDGTLEIIMQKLHELVRLKAQKNRNGRD